MCLLYRLSSNISYGVGWISDLAISLLPAPTAENPLWNPFHRVLELIYHCANSLLSPKPQAIPDRRIDVWLVLHLCCHVFEQQNTPKKQSAASSIVPASVKLLVTHKKLLTQPVNAAWSLSLLVFFLFVISLFYIFGFFPFPDGCEVTF